MSRRVILILEVILCCCRNICAFGVERSVTQDDVYFLIAGTTWELTTSVILPILAAIAGVISLVIVMTRDNTEGGSMEKTSRLPSAPSRLPTVAAGPRIQSGPPSGLPRLFGRIPALGPDIAYPPQVTVTQQVSVPQIPTPKEELPSEEDEWHSWVGKRVCISGIKKGTLMYYGTTSFAEGMFCGISLDEPEGRHDGEINGRRYFTCTDKHGVFAPISKVEKLGIPKLPPILSPEDLNRTFLSGKPCLNGTFTREKSPGNNLNNSFVNSSATCNGGLNETYVPVKSSSVGSNLDRTFNLKESPTATYPLQKTRHHLHNHSSNQEKICEETQFQCYDEEDSSLGLLTDSQMGDFSIEGLMFMPKTQSCDDINELPEHEVVQDITVQYLDESCASESIPYHSTPMSKTEIRQATFPIDHSISDDRSLSMLADQEFPSLAWDCTLGAVTENKTTNASSADDVTQPSEMPEEEALNPPDANTDSKQVIPITESLAPTLKVQQKVSGTGSSGDSSVTNETSGLVDIMTEKGERFTVSRETIIGALVSSISKSPDLPLELLSKLASSLSDSSSGSPNVTFTNSVSNATNETSPADVQLQEKSQRSLETSLTKSVEWNDVVVVQHTGDETKEERMSIEKVMEVIQAKGQSGQRPASTYTVGSADTGYQGDGEFDLQSEIETASPCEEMKPLVSPSVSTSLSLDDMNASGGTGKMVKSGHLSDSDFFTEDPGEAEEDAPSAREEADQPSESADGSAACPSSVVDETLVEQPVDTTFKIEKETEGAEPEVLPDASSPNRQEPGEAESAPADANAADDNIPKKKKLPHSGPVKKVVGVSKIKAMLETQPSVEQPKRSRTPKKSRWDAVTSKIQAGMAEDKSKPKREIKGRVDTNLVTGKAPPVPKKEGPGSVGPASTRSTPVTEFLNLLVDTDETASQVTTSARGASSVVSSCSQRRAATCRPISSSTASVCCSSSSTSSHCSVLSSIPSTTPLQQQQPSHTTSTRMPSKIAVRFQPRLETVAKISDQPKKATRQARNSITKIQKAAPQASKGVSQGTTTVPPRVNPRKGTTEPTTTIRPRNTTVASSSSTMVVRPQPVSSKVVKGQSSRAFRP